MGSKWKIRMLITLLLVLVLINFLSPANWPAPQQSRPDDQGYQEKGIPTGDTPLESASIEWLPEDKAKAEKLSQGRLNILLLGIDARSKEPSRTDSIMLLSINPRTDDAAALSVLRDTYVTIPNSARVQDRINTAFALGGPQLTLKTVSNFLQVPIQYYVVMDFQGFEKAVDAIGGVEVEVEKRMDYVDDGIYDIHLKPGRQVLSGVQALGYARFRHDERGDFSRVERQRKLVKALLAKAQGIQGFYYLPKIYQAIQPYVKTNLDMSTAAGLIYLGCKVKQVSTHTLPDESDFNIENIDGMSVLVPTNIQHIRTDVRKLLP